MSMQQAKQMAFPYMSKVGPSQFSWERYAMWLFENHPEVAAEALGEALRKSQ
jgi:predicted phosphoadenosine phosphosulfate sulfurtransferase